MYPTWLWYRFSRRVLNRYRRVTLFFLEIRYRYLRKAVSGIKRVSAYSVSLRYRLLRRLRFRYLRLFIFFVWRFWLRDVYGLEKIPTDGPAIIASNHLSYFDFWILSAILRKQTVFVAVKNLAVRGHVGWTMKLNPIIFIDRDKPGLTFFKKILWYLKEQRRLVVIYPEGTRSRTGKMLTPKVGFVKLAVKAGVPIIPIAMRGTYEILPPHKHIPKLKRCDVFVGDKIYISPQNPEFHDIFFRKAGPDRRYRDLDEAELQEIAFRIMDKVRVAAMEEWDESAVWPKFEVPSEVVSRKQELLGEKIPS